MMNLVSKVHESYVAKRIVKLKDHKLSLLNAKKSYLFLIVMVLSCNTITTKPTKSDEIAMIRESQTENDNHS